MRRRSGGGCGAGARATHSRSSSEDEPRSGPGRRCARPRCRRRIRRSARRAGSAGAGRDEPASRRRRVRDHRSPRSKRVRGGAIGRRIDSRVRQPVRGERRCIDSRTTASGARRRYYDHSCDDARFRDRAADPATGTGRQIRPRTVRAAHTESSGSGLRSRRRRHRRRGRRRGRRGNAGSAARNGDRRAAGRRVRARRSEGREASDAHAFACTGTLFDRRECSRPGDSGPRLPA